MWAECLHAAGNVSQWIGYWAVDLVNHRRITVMNESSFNLVLLQLYNNVARLFIVSGFQLKLTDVFLLV